MKTFCILNPASLRIEWPRAMVIWALFLTAGASVGQASSRWATLEAIHQLENPHNLTRPGQRGELGAYQFRPTTWGMHTTTPFGRALDRQISDIVAVRHYEYLKRGLENAHLPATPYNIALAWNGGLAAAIAGKSPPVARNYADRAANLARVLEGATVVTDAR